MPRKGLVFVATENLCGVILEGCPVLIFKLDLSFSAGKYPRMDVEVEGLSFVKDANGSKNRGACCEVFSKFLRLSAFSRTFSVLLHENDTFPDSVMCVLDCQSL